MGGCWQDFIYWSIHCIMLCIQLGGSLQYRSSSTFCGFLKYLDLLILDLPLWLTNTNRCWGRWCWGFSTALLLMWHYTKCTYSTHISKAWSCGIWGSISLFHSHWKPIGWHSYQTSRWWQVWVSSESHWCLWHVLDIVLKSCPLLAWYFKKKNK
jgi:hypothetical protein